MLSQPLADDQRRMLVEAARAATAQAFLTKEGGTRYGAAALSRSGRVYTAGQYSSFNHVTNVHAEQAAVLQAALAGDPDVLALAVASTADDDVTRPCGVCRQVLVEHAGRTGRDFEVMMARRDGGCEHARVSELLPWAWQSHTQAEGGTAGPAVVVRPALRRSPVASEGVSLEVGDHVVLPDGCVAMIWEPMLQPGPALTRIKYAPLPDGGLRKVAHSFTQALAYEAELDALGWARPTMFGAPVALAHVSELGHRLPMPAFDDCRAEAPPVLRGLLERGGIAEERVRVSGSRCLGLHRIGSDWDLVLRVNPVEVDRLRAELAGAVQNGTATLPKNVGLQPVLAEPPVGSRVRRVARLLAEVPRAADVVAAAPVGASFSPVADTTVEESRRLDVLHDLADSVGTAYEPGCLSRCGNACFCRERAFKSGNPCVSGTTTLRLIPNSTTLNRAEELSRGAAATPSEAPAATLLERAGRLYDAATAPTRRLA